MEHLVQSEEYELLHSLLVFRDCLTYQDLELFYRRLREIKNGYSRRLEWFKNHPEHKSDCQSGTQQIFDALEILENELRADLDNYRQSKSLFIQIGRNLQIRCQQLGLTPADLAAMTFYTEPQIVQIENGEAIINSIEDLHFLANILRTSLTELVRESR